MLLLKSKTTVTMSRISYEAINMDSHSIGARQRGADQCERTTDDWLYTCQENTIKLFNKNTLAS